MVFHNEDGNPARANIKQALGYLKDGDGDGNSQPHKGVKASANSDVMYFFTSAQDGDPSQDDVRLCLGDDLNKLKITVKDKQGILLILFEMEGKDVKKRGLKMKNEDEDEIKRLIWVNNHIANKREKSGHM
ncbi:hypothetical protein Tco_0051328 [Tanacetum coccineum]